MAPRAAGATRGRELRSDDDALFGQCIEQRRHDVKEAVMGKYIIHELQNLESVRKGDIYEGTLQGAKAKATREQVWQGTVLKITDEEGRTVAVKDQNAGVWYSPEG